MNLEDVGERDLAAAEYVLGTLVGAERRRFTQVMTTDAGLRSLVAHWEERLAALAVLMPPEEPSSGMWQRVEARLGQAAPADERALAGPTVAATHQRAERKGPAEPAVARLRRRLVLWRALALLAVAVAAGLGFLLERVGGFDALLGPAVVAVLEPGTGQDGWVITGRGDRARAVQIGGEVPVEGKVYVLWATPEGGAPVPVAVLRRDGPTRVDLAAARRRGVVPGTRLIVTLEREGDPTAAGPTGPTLYSGRLLVPEPS